MDESNVKAQQDLLRLRQRLLEFQKIGYMTPESFGTYEQTLLQIWQEAEQRRQTCLSQANTLRMQAAAAEAQAHAFSAMSSVMFAVINGFIEIEEKRIREEAEREAEREEAEREETERKRIQEEAEWRGAKQRVEKVKTKPRKREKA